MPGEKTVAHYLLWRIFVLLAVKSVRTPEVRDIALSGNTGAAEKHNTAALINHFL